MSSVVSLNFFKESVQGHSRGKVNILGGDTVIHCQKMCCMNMCLLLNGYRHRPV
jgi:hypothetical protein